MSVEPSSSVIEAVRVMTENNIGAIIVGHNSDAIGIFTEVKVPPFFKPSLTAFSRPPNNVVERRFDVLCLLCLRP